MKIMNYKSHIFYKLFLVLLILIVPWMNQTKGFGEDTIKISQEDVTYYEINPCKISLISFLQSNPKTIYQDHFFFRFNNYSSINCFGKISGLTVIDSNFYISIGTNTLINLLIQGLFWVLLLSFLPKNNDFNHVESNFKNFIFHHISTFFTTWMFAFSIFSEKRYYEKQLYYLKFEDPTSKLVTFLILYLIFTNLIEVLQTRSNSIFNYLPWIYIFHTVISGINFSFISAYFVYLGVRSIFDIPKYKKTLRVVVIFSVFWAINATGSYYFEPSKLRGFISSSYDFNSVLFWIFYYFLIIFGTIYLIDKCSSSFKLQLLINNFSMTSLLLLLLGFIGSAFPVFNFVNYYYFGQQKFGINRSNPFELDLWLQKMSWRGFFTSAETVGELFGLLLILIIYSYTKKKKLNFYETTGLISSVVGLYFSNNRTSALLVFLFCSYLLVENKPYKKIMLTISSSVFIIVLLYMFGFEDLTYNYDFIKSRVYVNSLGYTYDAHKSSFVIWLTKNFDSSSLSATFFVLLSVLGYFLNRSEIWGLFFARYNPTFGELFLGSGPQNLAQLYGENPVNSPETFLLPHSSLLSYLVYFGLIGNVIIVSILLFSYLKNKRKINSLGKIILLYVLINVFKNDVLNYFNTFLTYLFFLVLIIKFNTFKIFDVKNKLFNN